MKTRKYVLFAALLLFGVLLFPSMASAHAYIVKSSPSENEVWKAPPKKVTIQFDEKIQPVNYSIQVFDEDGKRVDRKDGRINSRNGTILECGLRTNLPKGTYQIQWKAVSGDGHPVQGVIPFQVGSGHQAKQPSTPGTETGYTPKIDLILIRWLQYASFACIAGMLFFSLPIVPREYGHNQYMKKAAGKMLQMGTLFLAVGTLLSLPLSASVELTASWRHVLHAGILKSFIVHTAFGHIWLIQIALLLCLAALVFFHSKTKNPALFFAALVPALGWVLTKAFIGHAASAPHPVWQVALDFLHLLSAEIWIGSLAMFAVFMPLARHEDTKPLYFRMIRAFSKWGIALVVVLAVTGVSGSITYVPNLRSLATTSYGKVLSAKILLLLVMVMLAALNFWNGRRSRKKGLFASVWGELATGLAVLVLSVILTNLPTAMAAPGPFKETKTVHQQEVTFSATPNVIGENTFTLSLKDRNGRPIGHIEQVTLTFTSLEMEMGSESKVLKKVKDGYYRAKGMDFNMAGRWNVHVHVLKKDLNTIDTDFSVHVGSQPD
nr:copper resistance protein CopC [Heyndrickxia coagulans]